MFLELVHALSILEYNVLDVSQDEADRFEERVVDEYILILEGVGARQAEAKVHLDGRDVTEVEVNLAIFVEATD